MDNNQKWLIGGVVGVLLLCACVGAACLTAGGMAAFGFNRSISQLEPDLLVTRAVTVEVFSEPDSRTPETPVDDPTIATPTPVPFEEPAPVGDEAEETLKILEEEIVPINDPRDLALRLEGKENIPETVEGPAAPLQVGQEQVFWATNVQTNENFQVNATLRYVTPHLYFWAENGTSFSEADVKRLSETFENEIYPTNREFFGNEWSPGVDNDPHLYILYARGLGSSIAGYFSAADELHPDAHQYSNAHEMFMINADNVTVGEEYMYTTVAHEFQHMIHWYRDRNEESWMNEGFSVLAEILNGYDVGGFDVLYVSNPDIQLTHWPSTPDSSPHYGASFLFLAYYLDRFGEEATKALVAAPDNGMDSVDNALASLNDTDPQTGEPITAEDVFADWVVTTLVNDPDVEDGRFAYRRYTSAPKPGYTEEVNNCSPEWQTRTVHQFGVDYIKLNCPGELTLNFEGTTEVGVLPVDAYSGDYAIWSNKGDESDMTLTREFDFSQVSGPITLKYRMWYDLEEDYDYLYLVVSEDGENWQILQTPSGRDRAEDPSGNAYGWGYNGQTGDWVEESVDLSQFAGKQVQVRFEYVTDAAVNGEGFLLDDVQIPEISYTEDFEEGEGEWQGEGFARIQNRLPQSFRVTLVQGGQTVSVQNVTLDENQSVSIPLQTGGDTHDLILVVSGVTRFTTQEANYRFSFQE